MIRFALSDSSDTFANSSIREIVDNMKGFLSIDPEEFFARLEFPKGLNYISRDAQRWFEVYTDNIREAQCLMQEFADKFRETVFQNNHRKPFYYYIIDFFRPGYSGKKLSDLATLKYWNIGH